MEKRTQKKVGLDSQLITWMARETMIREKVQRSLIIKNLCRDIEIMRSGSVRIPNITRQNNIHVLEQIVKQHQSAIIEACDVIRILSEKLNPVDRQIIIHNN